MHNINLEYKKCRCFHLETLPNNCTSNLHGDLTGSTLPLGKKRWPFHETQLLHTVSNAGKWEKHLSHCLHNWIGFGKPGILIREDQHSVLPHVLQNCSITEDSDQFAFKNYSPLVSFASPMCYLL